MPPPREDELPKAHRIFVGRAAELRAFETAAFAIPADRAILRVIHGPGGQGKTALCREMMRRTDADPSYGFLRRAVLDLHERPKTDPDLLLVWIRNEFAKAGLFMPCFDLALALAWERLRGEEPFPTLAKPWLGRTTETGKSAIGEGASDAAKWLKSDDASALLGEAVGDIPFVGFLLKRYGVKAIDKSKRAYLEWTRAPLQRLKGENGALKPPHELSALLPWMLAQDLNHHLAANPNERLVLFVDEYERVFDQGGASTRRAENPFDRHLRRLIQETNGLLAVFFSRERLPWEIDSNWRADLAGNQLLLGGLADSDADTFLRAVPIDDAAIQQAIIEGARERADPKALVYPLMLDLQVEHWRVLTARKQATAERFTVHAETFEGRCIELIERVLRDYAEPLQRTVEHLSVAQRFDRAAFEHVVHIFGTGLPLASFDRIAELSFVTRAPDDFLSLHNVIAASIRERLDPERRAASVDSLFRHFLERARVERLSDLTDAHVLALAEAAPLRRLQDAEGYVGWLASMTKPLHMAARYGQAASLWREAVSFVEANLGAEHPDTATSLNNLASLLNAQGDYAGAKPLYERALAICERTLGAEHPDTAGSLNNLAYLLNAQGDYAGAKPLYERALAIIEKALGAEHPDTATSLNNLGYLLDSQGDYAGAKPLFERALAITEKALGAEHPNAARSLNNLASLLNAQGDYAGAKPLFERALEIRERALGAEHPDTARSLNNLASLLDSQGDYAGAKPLYERALAICERALGAEHPDTATGLNNLAYLLNAQGDYAGAKPLYERALAISERVLGAEHPNTARSLNNLAYLLDSQEDYADAKPLFERALAIRERALGAEHPDTATSLNNLAYLLNAQGDYAGAKPLFERALAIRERALGAEHPDTATSLNNLGYLLNAQGDYAGAQPLFERALAIREKALGDGHPATATSLNNVAYLLNAQGDYAGAKPLYERALAIRERALGAEHPDTATSLNNLGYLLDSQGDYAGAKPHCERALAIIEKALGPNHSRTVTIRANLDFLLARLTPPGAAPTAPPDPE